MPLAKTPPKPPSAPRSPRPPRIKKPALRLKGPRIYHVGTKPEYIGGGPGLPPTGFLGPHVSQTEWMVYWALAKHFRNPKDPRLPPFIGGPPQWVYQKIEQGGRVPGGSVTDFVILNVDGTSHIGIRVETERWHIWAGSTQQAKDRYIKDHIKAVDQVVRIWDQHFIDDPTGEKICKIVAMAVKGIEMPNPVSLGLAQRVRP